MTATRMSAAGIVEGVRQGTLRIGDVVEQHLQRVAERNPGLNALVTVAEDEARETARLADERLSRGGDVRPLEGVPFVVKDTISTSGVRSTFGSRLYKDFVPEEDAVPVARLRAAGAILIGKTNVSEFGHDPYCNTRSEQFGVTRNPWNLNRTAGGSSGGVAAAVAVGMAPIGLATDWGGSIRGPAAFCGVLGLRPSPGRVPIYPHETLAGFAWDQPVEAVQGPIACNVDDLRTAYAVISGPDRRAPQSLAVFAEPMPDSGRDRPRIAYAGDFQGGFPLEPGIAAVCDAFLQGATGFDIHRASPAAAPALIADSLGGIRPLGVALRYAERYRRDPQSFGPFLRAEIARSLGADLASVARGERARTDLWHVMREFMEDFDVIATPTWGFAPFDITRPPGLTANGIQIGSGDFWRYTQVTQLFSLLGYPAISVPIGIDEEGLPVGMQFAAFPGHEAVLFEIALRIEQAQGVFALPPKPDRLPEPEPTDPMFDKPYASVSEKE